MNNQIILWLILVIPWSTLFFMKQADIRRFLPVGLLSVVTSIIISDTLSTLHVVDIHETAWPLRNTAFVLSMNLVLPMWMLKFFYRKFLLYSAIEIALNLGFAYVFLGIILPGRGIEYLGRNGALISFIIATMHSLGLYAYQIWQEKIFKHPYREPADHT